MRLRLVFTVLMLVAGFAWLLVGREKPEPGYTAAEVWRQLFADAEVRGLGGTRQGDLERRSA
jgi:hypothetical protein